ADNYNVDVYIQPIQDSTYTLKESDIEILKRFDALVVAKPTLPFTESDKIVMDQYIMNGGRMMILADMVDAEMDSIFRSGKIVAFSLYLKIHYLLFIYGVRFIPTMFKDLEAANIVLADGES